MKTKYLGRTLAAATLWSLLPFTANAYQISDCDTSIDASLRTCSSGDLSQGWDGAGLGSYNFGYYLDTSALPTGISASDVETAFLNATATWSSVVQVSFTEVANFGDGEIDFYFHDETNAGHEFDGAWNPSAGTGSVFAHTWGPTDVSFSVASGISNPGNMHFDIDENWVTTGSDIDFLASAADIDLESIILHELGHALGLGHEDSMGSGAGAPIMQSYHNVSGTWGRTLTADDIAGIRTLYACAGADCQEGRIPEPETIALLGIGMVSFIATRRRKKP